MMVSNSMLLMWMLVAAVLTLVLPLVLMYWLGPHWSVVGEYAGNGGLCIVLRTDMTAIITMSDAQQTETGRWNHIYEGEQSVAIISMPSGVEVVMNSNALYRNMEDLRLGKEISRLTRVRRWATK